MVSRGLKILGRNFKRDVLVSRGSKKNNLLKNIFIVQKEHSIMISFNKKSLSFVALMLLGSSAHVHCMDMLKRVTSMPQVPYVPGAVAKFELPPVNGNTVIAGLGGLLVAKTLYQICQRKALRKPHVAVSTHTASTIVHVDLNDSKKDVQFPAARVTNLAVGDVNIPVVYWPNNGDVLDLVLHTGVLNPALTLENVGMAIAGAKGTAFVVNKALEMMSKK